MPNLDDTHLIKWKRSLRKKLINCLALIENHGTPSDELAYELKKARDCFNNWKDSGDFEKVSATYPLDEPKDLNFPTLDE